MGATRTGPAAPFSQEDIDRCLQALVAWAGNGAAAVRWLEANSDEGQRIPGRDTLLDWSRTTHWERYEQIRDQWAGMREKSMANDQRDLAQEAIDATRLAVEKARERLEANRDPEPAKSPAALSKVAASSTHDLLTLTQRPTQIHESRNVEEILRGLVAKGYLQLTDEPAAIEAESLPAAPVAD